MNEEQTYYYEISRYQDESSLRSKLRLKTFKQIDKINILLDIAKALKAAHKENVFHRDVCPENIFVYEGGKAALANFGRSWFEEHMDLSFTVGANLNSPYTPPEFLENDVCTGSDIYSLGVIFYELMVGRVPFDNVRTFAIALGGILSEDVLPSHVVKDLPKWMDDVVKNTIVGDPTKRWQTADEFIDFITNAMDEELKTASKSAKSTTSKDPDQKLYLKDMKPGMKVSPSMTLHDILGRGGFGRVFKVWHDMQKQYLAIKIFERDASIDNALNCITQILLSSSTTIVQYQVICSIP